MIREKETHRMKGCDKPQLSCAYLLNLLKISLCKPDFMKLPHDLEE